MPVVSAGDLTLLRSEEHRSRIRASFFVAPILWEARIDDIAIVKGETSIDFDAGSGSFFSMIEALQEVWVGTGIQKDDTGRLRVKSISSGDAGVTGTLVVAGHSHQLQDDQYLTFKHDYPIVPRHSFIEYVSPGVEIWYMDDDIAYSDQNTKPPPIVVAGGDRAGFLDPTSGEWAINVDVSNSRAMAGTISSYALTVASTADTAVVNFSSVTGLGDITFDTAGYYWAKYSVTDSNGKTQVSYRLYYVHDLDRSAGSYPFIDCDTVTLENEWENGGWTAGLKAQDEFSFADIPDHASCIIWGESFYDGTESQITFLDDNATTVFAGYVRSDSDARDWAAGIGEVDIVMSTAEGVLRNIHEFSTSLLAKDGTPAKWHEGKSTQKIIDIIHNAWRWRTTLFERVDVLWETNDTWLRIFGGLDEGNPFDMANVFLYEEGIRSRVMCDQGGRIHIVEDQQLMIDSDRSGLTTSFEITNLPQLADYGGLMAIPRKPEFEVPFVTGNGVYWAGAWDAEDMPVTEEYCSIAPGGKPLWRGAMPQDKPLQTVISQDHLNKVIGRWEAKINNPVQEFRIELHGNYVGVFDCAYGHQYITDLQASDNPRGIVWSNKPLYLRNTRATYTGLTGSWNVGCSFEPEHITTDGIYTECPSFPELGGALPVIPAPAEVPGALLTGASVNFKGALGDLWDKRLTQAVTDVVEDPYWRTKQGTASPSSAIVFRCGVGFIKRSTDAFDTVDVDVTPGTNPPNDSADSPAPTNTTVTYTMGEGSRTALGEFVFLATWQNVSSVWRSWLAFTDDNGSTWSWKSLGGTPSLACQELSGVPVELDGGTITDLRVGGMSNEMTSKQICEIDTDKYVVAYMPNSSPYEIYVQVVNVSTGFPVLGTKKLTDLGGQTTAYPFNMCKVDTNKFAILDNYYADPQIQICTVSGSTITTGTATNWISAREISELCGDADTGTAQSNGAYKPIIHAPNSTTLHLGRMGIKVGGGSCTRQTSTEGFHVCKGTISGTTFTPDTIACDIYTVNEWDTSTTGFPPEPGKIDQIVMSSNVTLFAYGIGTGVYSYILAYDSSTGLGTPVQFSVGAGTPTNFALARLSDTKAILFAAEETGFDSEVYAMVVTLTGTAVALGNTQKVYTKVGVATYGLKAVPISSTKAVGFIPDSLGVGCQVMMEVTANTTTNLITDYDVCAYGWPYVLANDVHSIDADDFLLLRDAATISGTPYDPSVTIGSYADVLACSASYSGPVMALGLSIGKSAGDKVWITANRSDELFVLEYALPALTQSNAFSLGAATFATTIDKTWTAYPYVPFGYDDAVYVWGRMNNPQSLGSPSHVIRTINGGGAWTLLENTWLNDYCGSLIIGVDGYMYAIRNRAAQAKLYRDTKDNALLLRYTLPFDAPVAPHGMILDWLTGDIYACSWFADPIMVALVGKPYVFHSDLTFDHDNTDGIEAIVRL